MRTLTLLSGKLLVELIVHRPLTTLNKPEILQPRKENMSDEHILKERINFLYPKRHYNTPEQEIPSEQCLLDSDYDPLHSVHSFKGVHLEYLSDRDDEDPNLGYIPFDLEKDDEGFNPAQSMNRNLELEKSKFPSFHEFNSEDYELGGRLYSPNDSFHL